MNFSGGKDSTYMLLEMIRRNMRIDAVVFADTTMEFPPMYEHIDRVEQFLKAERGIPVTRLRAEYSFEQFMFDTMKGNTEYSTPGYGWPNISVRWCTWALKVQMIQAFSRALDTRPYHYIGFAADETKRLKRKSNQHPMKRYPLVEWGVTEAEALAACYREGYTWDGLYEHFSRVSCWCCPLQNLKELRTLRELYPEIWAELRRLDDRAIAQFGQDNAFGQFRPKESIRMLELRFDFEKEWASHGWSIRSKAFYRALDRLYQQSFPAPDDPVEELLSFLTEDDLQVLSLIEKKGGRNKKQPKKRGNIDRSR